eukprot:1474126-Rhodomonas_salina.3
MLTAVPGIAEMLTCWVTRTCCAANMAVVVLWVALFVWTKVEESSGMDTAHAMMLWLRLGYHIPPPPRVARRIHAAIVGAERLRACAVATCRRLAKAISWVSLMTRVASSRARCPYFPDPSHTPKPNPKRRSPC